MRSQYMESLHTALNELCADANAQRKLGIVRKDAEADLRPQYDEPRLSELIAARMMNYVLTDIQYGNW